MGGGAEGELACDATARARFGEVGSIGMDVQDHVRFLEADDGVRLGGKVIKELVDLCDGAFGGLTSLFARDRTTERSKDGHVDGPCIIEGGADNLFLLDS